MAMTPGADDLRHLIEELMQDKERIA